jgi:hypothetical protein
LSSAPVLHLSPALSARREAGTIAAAPDNTQGPIMEVTLRRCAALMLGIGLLWGAVDRSAAIGAPSSSVPPPPIELSKLSYAFANAAASGDAEAAAKLSRFPLDNVVQGSPKTLSRTEFLKRFKADLTRHKDIVDCLLANNLEIEVRNGQVNVRKWSIDCNGNVYHFGLTGDRWSYTGYENINE